METVLGVTTTTAQTTMMVTEDRWRVMDLGVSACLSTVDPEQPDDTGTVVDQAEVVVIRGRTHHWPPALMPSTLRSISCRHRRRPTLEVLLLLPQALPSIKIHLDQELFVTHLQRPPLLGL